MERRIFKDPEYKKWRLAVYKRDGWICRMPGCKSRSKRLNAHHIKRWADYPSLRYVLSNGITLCRICHNRVHGREEEFEVMFTRIVGPTQSDASLLLMMKRYVE